MSDIKVLRNYEMNIASRLLENEEIIVANDKLKSILNSRRTATINVYLYLCMKVNNSKDKGYIRNIR